MSAKTIFWSWDFIVAFALSIGAYYFLPNLISDKFSIQLYNIGVSVLSIVFSVFFASLAVIIAAPSDDFVKFFNANGAYNNLLKIFKYTLMMLFLGLFYSIAGFIISSYFVEEYSEKLFQNKAFVCGFVFIFSYSLFCSFNSAKDAILYSLYRNRFLEVEAAKRTAALEPPINEAKV